MTKYRGVDFRRYDSRIVSLQTIIIGLDNSILTLKRKVDEFDYYDGLWLLEESEPIFGLAFIAFQNYINSSIYDRFEELEKQHLKYKSGNKVNFSGRTEVELIITLANYFKHRDQPKDLFPETRRILLDFGLQSDKDLPIVDSPIFKGLDLLSETWDLTEVMKKTEIWREEIWTIES